MINLYPLAKPLLMAMEPEQAHRLTLRLLKTGLAPRFCHDDPALRCDVFGHRFPNPLGLAAGFDKDAEVLAPMLDMGFGFVEAGTVTPLPQDGNPAPRLFRDAQNRSVINRLGFPGKGLEYFVARVSDFRVAQAQAGADPLRGLLGVNIGINKETVSAFEDYSRCLSVLAPMADYITVNVSSPNTPGLRDLQSENMLDALLAGLMAVMGALDIPPVARPALLLKVAPDLTPDQRAGVAQLALRHRISGLVVSNTTLARPEALAPHLKDEAGGLSGRLLKDKACSVLADFYRLTRGQLPLVGVGGIENADDAWRRIRAGASLVQVYTGLVYEGPALVPQVLKGLSARLRDAGLRHISEAVGADVDMNAEAEEAA
ncbi:MAG: quinone-dependent dihydroorotate dehydrogenase [Alphaproteobacteria bacterium]|nr:quinone-dependent dihydroorotate dehydrogenase [Alphaproteobacteria bacterium]